MINSNAKPRIHDRPAYADQPTPLSLLQLARGNDQNAWSRLFALYRRLVLFWCARCGLAAEDAEDIAQEVFASAAAALADFRRDRPGDTFRGWLRTITRNAILMHHRRNQGKACAEGGSDAWRNLCAVPDPVVLPEEEAEQVGQLYCRIVDFVRGEFAERTWHMFWLSVIEGRTTAAVAVELGVSAATIRQARSRVLRRIKQEAGDILY